MLTFLLMKHFYCKNADNNNAKVSFIFAYIHTSAHFLTASEYHAAQIQVESF